MIYLQTWWTGFEVYGSITEKSISVGTKGNKTNLSGICGALVIIHGRTHQYVSSILDDNYMPLSKNGELDIACLFSG
jgi:hypothetical protein